MKLLLTLAVSLIIVAPAQSAARPNIILIVTDDQRADAASLMPVVKQKLAGRGITFSRAFVSNPICCPSRATILTGRHSHTTGVWSNRLPFGALDTFRASGAERATLAVALQAAGYRTGLVGKYLNGYRGVSVPPGWDEWMAFKYGWGYYDYALNVNGRTVRHGDRPQDYSTDVLGKLAAGFVRRARKPFFLYFAPAAPHTPTIPAPRHESAELDLPPFSPPSREELDLSDKPAYVQSQAREERKGHRYYRGRQFRALLAVDEAVGQILTALEQAGKTRETIIVFTSDNGVQWGEHGLAEGRKGVPYEGSTRVPLVIRYDPLTSAGGTDSHLVGNVDFAPTFARLAGIPFAAEGRSLLPLLARADPPEWRQALLLQGMGGEAEDRKTPAFCGMRTEGHSYVVYETGEEELYDLGSDPHQLESRAHEASFRRVRENLRGLVREACFPLPPGFHADPLCTLRGSGGNDQLLGGRGPDYACGGGGHDRVQTGAGSDTVDIGAATAAELARATFFGRASGPAGSRVETGSGNDRVLARNGRRDLIWCGPGSDRVIADRYDVIGSGCERVSRPRS